MESKKQLTTGLTSFLSNQQAVPVLWNRMKWMPQLFFNGTWGLFIVRRDLLNNCKRQRQFWKSANSSVAKIPRTHLSMVSMPPPTGTSCIENHFSCHRQPTHLPSWKRWHILTPGMTKLGTWEIVIHRPLISLENRRANVFQVSFSLAHVCCGPRYEWHDRKVRGRWKRYSLLGGP